MSEWIAVPDMALDNLERSNHIERYQYATQVLKGVVLDCACGMGYGTEILRTKCNVKGVDIDPAAIALAKERYPFGIYECGDIISIEMDADALVCFETLEHLDDPAAVIRRLPLRVRDIVASVPIVPTVGWNDWHRTDFTKDSFRELIESGGFEIIHEIHQKWTDGGDLYLMVHGWR